MNEKVFKNWSADKLIPNLPKDTKTLVVLDNAKYHCRLMEKNTFNENEKKMVGLNS